MRPCQNRRKIARQVVEGVIHCAVVLSIAAIRCEKKSRVLLPATLRATKNPRNDPCYTVQFSATCLAMALRDKLLRKLHSVTGPLLQFPSF